MRVFEKWQDLEPVASAIQFLLDLIESLNGEHQRRAGIASNHGFRLGVVPVEVDLLTKAFLLVDLAKEPVVAIKGKTTKHWEVNQVVKLVLLVNHFAVLKVERVHFLHNALDC